MSTTPKYFDNPALRPVTRQTQRVAYAMTSADVAQGWAVVPILWPEPFADLGFTATWGVRDLDAEVTQSFWVGDMHNFSATGFEAVVYTYGPGQGNAGDSFVVHAIAEHD